MVVALLDQVVYHDPMAAMRAQTLLQLGHFSSAETACSVTYDTHPWIKTAPWRLWMTMQIKYHTGDLPAAISTGEQLVAALAKPATEEEMGPSGTANNRDAVKAVGIKLPSAQDVQKAIAEFKEMLQCKEDGNAAIKAG